MQERGAKEIYSLGHSTQQIESFLDILDRHEIQLLADIRRFPGSRRHPHFNKDALAAALAERGIEYMHFPQLGGRRSPRKDSVNGAWEVEAFRGYADHMQSSEFKEVFGRFMEQALEKRSAYMCAEGLWWRCHRRLVSDAFVARGWRVRHIMPGAETQDHALTDFAVVEKDDLFYPAARQSLPIESR